jgi:two-component system cell cycle sensor histidine kinase/response regulator CckA
MMYLLLRKQAEAKVGAMEAQDLEALSPEAAKRLLYELRIHQIELEMQNEELRQTQQALEASRARYFDLYDLAPVGYFTLNEPGLILEANLTTATLLGAARGALVKQPLTRAIVPEDQDIYYRYRQQLFATGEPPVCELRMLRQDGTPFWARLEAIVAPEGETGVPVCRVTMSDITEHKRVEEEKEKLQTKLNEARKMELVGRLAGGVAHDFNNMLQVIIGHVELALEETHSADPRYLDLQEIQKAALRSADLTRQLLAFARNQTASPRVLDLNDTVVGMIKMPRRLIGEDIDLAWKPGQDLWKVKIDPSQIDQILANLVVNARDAIAGVGKVTIETANMRLDDSYYADHQGFVPGEYVLLAVSDTGAGMNQEVLAHLFEPFFTTKEVGKGTGLGLATVYGIVTQNQGFVDVYSQPGQGTAFRIYFPRLGGETVAMKTETVTGEPPGGTETVLIVEDEEAIMKLGKRLLERLGYTVLTANTPGQALRLVGEHAGDIHLLITDVVMPEMNGRELAERLSPLKPGMQCLFMSGYTANALAHHGVLDEDLRLIQKPFLLKDLAAKVREVLDR